MDPGQEHGKDREPEGPGKEPETVCGRHHLMLYFFRQMKYNGTIG